MFHIRRHIDHVSDTLSSAYCAMPHIYTVNTMFRTCMFIDNVPYISHTAMYCRLSHHTSAQVARGWPHYWRAEHIPHFLTPFAHTHAWNSVQVYNRDFNDMVQSRSRWCTARLVPHGANTSLIFATICLKDFLGIKVSFYSCQKQNVMCQYLLTKCCVHGIYNMVAHFTSIRATSTGCTLHSLPTWILQSPLVA